MKIIPGNKQLRAVLIGCAALSAVMAGPMILDAGAQALPQAATCTAGGVCLTSSQTGGTPVTITVTTTVPTTTTETSTTTDTLTHTTTVPATTTTVTVTAPPVTSTVTDTVTTGTTSTVTVTRTGFPTTFSTTRFGGPDVHAGVAATTTTPPLTTTTPPVTTTTPPVTTTTPPVTTTTSGSCGTPGTTTSLGDGEVETCGPTSGHIAIFATTPGVYVKIFDNTTSYDVSAGIFAPQFRFGFLDGCYYVPDQSSVASPGQTVTTNGTLTDAVAFGLHTYDVSNPIRVPRSDCGGNNPAPVSRR
jgi:hypothetical protein